MTTATTRTLRFAAYDLRRLLGDWAMLFFSMVLPVVLYLVFGAAMGYGSERVGSGNVKAYVMVGMALYAGITGAVAAAGSVVVEADTGWGRQLALTPLTPGSCCSRACSPSASVPSSPSPRSSPSVP